MTALTPAQSTEIQDKPASGIGMDYPVFRRCDILASPQLPDYDSVAGIKDAITNQWRENNRIIAAHVIEAGRKMGIHCMRLPGRDGSNIFHGARGALVALPAHYFQVEGHVAALRASYFVGNNFTAVPLVKDFCESSRVALRFVGEDYNGRSARRMSAEAVGEFYTLTRALAESAIPMALQIYNSVVKRTIGPEFCGVRDRSLMCSMASSSDPRFKDLINDLFGDASLLKHPFVQGGKLNSLFAVAGRMLSPLREKTGQDFNLSALRTVRDALSSRAVRLARHETLRFRSVVMTHHTPQLIEMAGLAADMNPVLVSLYGYIHPSRVASAGVMNEIADKVRYG